VLIGHDIAGKKLERHKPAQSRIFSFVNHSHPAATEFFNHSVMRNGLANNFVCV
jgi:hypothetical protein